MHGKLLIANRGEIAIRIARTASALGLAPVMVHSDDDADMLHLKFGDTARALPGSGVAAYLDGAALIRIAREIGSNMVHPGYGLLSERADFARACSNAGLVFIGPDPDTLDQLGDKVRARDLARSVGVAVIPGSGPLDDPPAARAFFETLNGAAMMLKAAHGGGGRGMRVIETSDRIDTEFARCAAEALSAFGDATLFAERLVRTARHIEVQIIGDGTTALALGDRDCSLQRRNQKVVELAPAPGLSPDTRATLYQQAVALARAASYRGIGTIEFLYDPTATDGDNLWFIEANPRLQVEHTITEETTGLDLVEQQLRIATGATLGDLGLKTTPPTRGIAIQTRISTEQIRADGTVSPTSGTITGHETPGGPGIRVDGHGFAGYTPNPRFDPLLAKLIVHEPGGDMARLLNKTSRALGEFRITGTDSNLAFLQAIVARPELATWSVTTNSLDTWRADLVPKDAEPKPRTESNDLPDDTEMLRSPIQAALISISVKPGDIVTAGTEIAVVEALKMQQGIVSPHSGTVLARYANPGDILAENAPLVAISVTQTPGATQSTQNHPDPGHIRPDLKALNDRLAHTLDENRPKAIERRRARNQRTTRENIAALCQGGAFHEYGQLVIAGQRRKHGRDAMIAAAPADGIVTGIGTVNGNLFDAPHNQVALLAYDSTVMAGTQGMFGHMKTDRIIEIARDQNLASIFFTEGGGGRPNDTDFADILHSGLGVTTFSVFASLRGRGPKITVNSGYCFAGNAALFGAGDIRIATKNSWIGLGGPAMIEAGGLGRFDPKEVGPAPMHAQTGGLDILVEDDEQAADTARRVMALFQGNLPETDAADQRALRHIVPENRKRAYRVHEVIETLTDGPGFVELGAAHAPGLITGLGRINGRAIGLIANNPLHLGGALDAPASAKGARFLRLCNRFALPVLSLCDTPGFMVGPASEEQGSVAAACDFIGAGAALDVPLFFVCLRKGYGIGAQAMAGGSFANPMFTIAWPSGEFGAMGLEGAVRLGFARELAAETDPAARAALFDKHVAHAYREGSALNVASFREIDAVIDPADTRGWITRGLDLASGAARHT